MLLKLQTIAGTIVINNKWILNLKNSTIKDIANEINVSSSTVSRALSDHPDISEKTKTLVKKVAEEFNYNPNLIAQSLKSQRTKTIGVVVPEIDHIFFSAAISGIEEVAYRAGYTIMVCRSNEDVNREILNLDSLLANRVAGVIASISQTTKDGAHFQKLINNNVPVVFFDRVIEDIDACKVIINDKKSAINAVNHLIEKGYSKIAHFTGPKELNVSKHRLAGFREAMAKNNLKVNEDWIIVGGLHEKDGYSAFEKLLELPELPDAIFAINDPNAVGAMKKMREVGIKIPDDIAIIGFSNNPVCEIIIPNLTTIHQPAYEMGKKSTELMFDSISGNKNSCNNKTIVLDSHLVVRDSC